jgi:hypothetical protein
LIKLDIEGGELFALHGARQLLVQTAPVLIVEYKLGDAAHLTGRGAISTGGCKPRLPAGLRGLAEFDFREEPRLMALLPAETNFVVGALTAHSRVAGLAASSASYRTAAFA